ncbi:exported hypothetical protein [Gammaproteobacteria bacterium]
MKKLLNSTLGHFVARLLCVMQLLMVPAAFAVGGSSIPGASVVDGVYEWGTEFDIGGAAQIASGIGVSLPDTLASNDSTLLVTKYHFPTGREYILRTGPCTGTAAESVSLAVRVDYYDANKNFLYSVRADTLSGSAGRSVLLPINRTAYGYYTSIVLKSVATLQGTQVILPNRCIIQNRRPVMIMKNWQ